jgi:hypothetical protein
MIFVGLFFSVTSLLNYFNLAKISRINIVLFLQGTRDEHNVLLDKKDDGDSDEAMENVICTCKKSIILTFFNGYEHRLLVMIFSIIKNYLSCLLIFDFSQLTEKPATNTQGYQLVQYKVVSLLLIKA